MGTKVASNAQDRFVITMGSRILVVTQGGDVFGLDVANNRIGEAFQLSGPKVASNPQDRFLVAVGGTLIVTTQTGEAFGHDISGNAIGEPFKFNTESKVAFNPQDKYLLSVDNKLVVITDDGSVFGHEVSGRDVRTAFQFTGSRAAVNPQDRFVVGIGNRIIVTTQDGGVFGHDISDHDVGQPFRFTGSRMGFNPQDRFLFALGRSLVVSVQDGSAFGAEVSGRDVGPIVLLNPPSPPSVLDFDFNPIGFSGGVPVGGFSHLTIRQDGSFTFSGHFHDSGGLEFNISLAVAVKDSQNQVYTFTHVGHVSGTFEPGSRDDDWRIGSRDDLIAINWEKLAASSTGKMRGICSTSPASWRERGCAQGGLT